MTSESGTQRQLIDGKLVEASDGRRFENVNPATLDVVAEVPDATAADIDAAIGAARRAFDTTDWSTNRAFRKRCLEQLQAALESEREELRAELIAEAGCPLLITYGPQLDAPLGDALSWPAAQIDRFAWSRDEGERTIFGSPCRHLVVKEPVGVVTAITPWNFPFEVEINKLAQALATGNTLVLKPAPDTPSHALRMARLIAEQTDIPAGVVNIVTPSDHLLGELFLGDSRVDLVSFTGSTRVGQRVMELGAASFKRVFLELGGKSAHIVLDDADFATVLPSAAGVAAHAGQGCGMLTRLLLPRSRHDEGVEIVKAAVEAIRVGDPTDPSVLCGPVINARQRDRVTGYIERGVAEGGRLVTGGPGRPDVGLDGYFVQPTVFAATDNSMTIAREEVFGPVLSVIPYDDDVDAIAIANDSPYGLSGAVSGSPDRALAVAMRVRTGSLSVNGAGFYAADLPYGGYKSSGVGRQGGVEGFEQYLETKTIGLPPTSAEAGR
jgi:aldehyde dehydrogenase (NAD+)